MPKITILMPVYNVEKYINICIKSILSQTFKDFELLIINDASIDNTLEEISKFKDKRIRVLQNYSNIGLRNCLNMVTKLIDSEYISRTDGDDICASNRLELQYNALHKNKDYVFCGSFSKRFYEDINEDKSYIVTSPQTHEHIINRLFFCKSWGGHPLLRSNIFQKYNLNYEFPEPAEDYKLYCELTKVGKFMNIPKVLYYYRINPQGISSQKQEDRKNLYVRIFKQLVEELIEKEISKDELKIHTDIIFNNYHVTSKSMLIDSHEWLLNIYQANHKNKKYDQKIFANYLSEYWLNITQSATEIGLVTWLRYIASPLKKYKPIGFKNNFTLFKNCLFKEKSSYYASNN